MIKNPLTNRSIKVGGDIYKKLLKDGVIKPPEPKVEPEPRVEPEPEVEKELMTAAVNTVAKNKKQFVGLSQKETDKMLKKLLYEKLVLSNKKDKKKKKKKKKYYSSSESSSESSDSESD